MTETRPKKIILQIDKVIFHNPETGHVIVSGMSDGWKKYQVTGQMDNVFPGSVIEATGYWKRHEKYGWQFKASDIRVMSKDPYMVTREALLCKVDNVKVLKDDTGFCNAKAFLLDETPVKLSGRLSKLTSGATIYALGEWKHSDRFGDSFAVRQWEYYRPNRPGSLQKSMEFIETLRTLHDGNAKVVELDWRSIELCEEAGMALYNGTPLVFPLPGSKPSYNVIKNFLSERLPKLKVYFDKNGKVKVYNPGVMRDAITLMSVRHKLTYGKMETSIKNQEIIAEVSEMKPEITREFVPRDVTPYLNFLQDKQSDMFNVVPIEEYNGGTKEDSFLFTLVINENPCIIWENTNPSRATFIFICSDETYEDMLQKVCSFVADQRESKRRYLHSDASAVTFGQKPVCLVHNTYESWTQRLMEVENE